MIRKQVLAGWRYTVWRPVVGLCLAAVSLSGCSQGDGAVPSAQTRLVTTTAEEPTAQRAAVPAGSSPSGTGLPAVTVARIERVPWPRTIRVQGSLWGDDRVVVGTKVAGRVKEVKVDLGDDVQEGDVLATLSPEEFDLKVQQAQAQVVQVCASLGIDQDDDPTRLALNPLTVPAVAQEVAAVKEAKSHWDRAQVLSGIISKEEMDQRQGALEVAEARYQAACHAVNESIALLQIRKTELALAIQAQVDSVIRAPFAGTVEERQVSPGAYLQVGDPVAIVVKNDPLRFRAGVPESEAWLLTEAGRGEPGRAVEIFVRGRTEPLRARITRISPSVDLASRSLTIEADLPNPDTAVRSGVFAEAEIVVEPEAKALAVPADSVTEFAGVEKVWLVRGGQAEQHVIRSGRRGRWRALDGNSMAREVVTVRPDWGGVPELVEILSDTTDERNGVREQDMVATGILPKQAGRVEIRAGAEQAGERK